MTKKGWPHREASPLKQTADREAAEVEKEPVPAGEPEETTTEDPKKPDEPEPGPLSKLQIALQELLDYDQITEIRLALYSRETELEKHTKKGSDLGVREEDARRRLGVIRGSDLRFGLVRIFAEAPATEQRDVFFDRESPNGRPSAEITLTFRTMEGEEVTCTLEQLELADRIQQIRKLYQAGMLPADVEKAVKDGDFWYLIEDEEAERALAEAGGVEA